MTAKQKLIIGFLTGANCLVILALVMTVTGTAATPDSPTSRQDENERTPSAREAASEETCQWQAAQLLAQSGLTGGVVWQSSGRLQFDISSPIAPGQEIDEVAQGVWQAFDIALIMERGCPETPLKQVAVTISAVEVPDEPPAGSVAEDAARLNQVIGVVSAWVEMADLMAFESGDLSDDEFLERVVYRRIEAAIPTASLAASLTAVPGGTLTGNRRCDIRM